MYNFVDTTEVSEGIVLPSEALQINGVYIEEAIPGYRTLNVEGREALSPEVSTYETGLRDGSTIKGKRYPARIITVTYQLKAGSNGEFREMYNQLGRILDVNEATLIFNDEPDKYYTGTPCTIDSVPPGKNAVVGKFEILCTDPFKYSVTEYSADVAAGENDVTVHYGGTYKAYPVLEAEFFDEKEVADEINRRRANGGRIIAVGTTSCRVLESVTTDDGVVQAISGETGIFIYPGYKFKAIDALITNFHLPESTLIMLVSALAGKEFVMDAYEEAVKENYRFFSFGDAMFVE